MTTIKERYRELRNAVGYVLIDYGLGLMVNRQVEGKSVYKRYIDIF